MTFIITAGVSCKLKCTKNKRSVVQRNIKTIKTIYNLQLRKIKSRLSTRWPKLALRLNEQVVVATVVPLHMEIEYTLIVKTFGMSVEY